jgi:hypothetical protein
MNNDLLFDDILSPKEGHTFLHETKKQQKE